MLGVKIPHLSDLVALCGELAVVGHLYSSSYRCRPTSYVCCFLLCLFISAAVSPLRALGFSSWLGGRIASTCHRPSFALFIVFNMNVCLSINSKPDAMERPPPPGGCDGAAPNRQTKRVLASGVLSGHPAATATRANDRC